MLCEDIDDLLNDLDFDGLGRINSAKLSEALVKRSSIKKREKLQEALDDMGSDIDDKEIAASIGIDAKYM